MNSSLDTLNTEKIEQLTNSDSENTQQKRGRGRPAKYTKEEREQKYKESRVQWNKEHKEERKESYRTYYANHSDEMVKISKDYQDRSRYALKLLSELWSHPEYLNINETDPLCLKIKNLIQHKKIQI